MNCHINCPRGLWMSLIIDFFYFQALCPVKPTFKVLLLKEYRGISLSAPSLPKSPRKSAKEYTETVEDLVAPFDHYLDESILEEDFMIEGNIRNIIF